MPLVDANGYSKHPGASCRSLHHVVHEEAQGKVWVDACTCACVVSLTERGLQPLCVDACIERHQDGHVRILVWGAKKGDTHATASATKALGQRAAKMLCYMEGRMCPEGQGALCMPKCAHLCNKVPLASFTCMHARTYLHSACRRRLYPCTSAATGLMLSSMAYLHQHMHGLRCTAY